MLLLAPFGRSAATIMTFDIATPTALNCRTVELAFPHIACILGLSSLILWLTTENCKGGFYLNFCYYIVFLFNN